MPPGEQLKKSPFCRCESQSQAAESFQNVSKHMCGGHKLVIRVNLKKMKSTSSSFVCHKVDNQWFAGVGVHAYNRLAQVKVHSFGNLSDGNNAAKRIGIEK